MFIIPLFPHFVFRERYVNFVCSLDMMEDIPMKTLFTLFKQNLNKAQMLTYIYVFNSQTWADELEFVYGTKDKEQWKVSVIIVQSVTVLLLEPSQCDKS